MDLKAMRKSAMLTLGLIAVCGMSAPAYAQSGEYRRGYEQGYRDGLEAARRAERREDRRDDRRGFDGRISIELALYGFNSNVCDAAGAVQRIVGRDDGRRGVDIDVNNDLCGDPAPRRVKRLEVRYRCGGGALQTVRAEEGQTLTLDCRR